MERLKLVKKAKEEERKKRDDELEGKDKSKKKILDNYTSSNGTKIKDIPPEEQKRIDDLTAEQIPIRVFIDIIKTTIDRINKKRMLYESLIDDLKKIKDEKTYEEKLDYFKKKLEALKAYEDKIEDLSSKEPLTDEKKTENRKIYEDTYFKEIKELEQIPTSGGRRRNYHNTRRHKRSKPKKTIRKNMKKSANKKNRTYKRRKMAKKTIRYRTRM